MDELIRNTVSKYIKVAAAQITAQTLIDRSAVASSIILHRMYAQLANEGFAVKDYSTIKTYGQLLANIDGSDTPAVDPAVFDMIPTASPLHSNELPVGIDIENISALPVVSDFREDAFYTMNFAPAEIGYCILQTNPYASFAGLFAAKEAIVKADNSYQNRPFNTILIDHLPGGKPVFPGFQLSLSHTNELAIAVAVKNISLPAASPLPIAGNPGNSNFYGFASIAAILLSIFTLLLLFVRTC
jgi:phosphopantetheinyl transferase (holo-ACP synthase)